MLGWHFLIMWFHSILWPTLFVGIIPILFTGEKKKGPGILDNSFNVTHLGNSRGKIAWRSAISRIFVPSSTSTVLRWLSMPLSYPDAKSESGELHSPALGWFVTDACLKARTSQERPGFPLGLVLQQRHASLLGFVVEHGLFSRVLSSQKRTFFAYCPVLGSNWVRLTYPF